MVLVASHRRALGTVPLPSAPPFDRRLTDFGLGGFSTVSLLFLASRVSSMTGESKQPKASFSLQMSYPVLTGFLC